MDMQMKIRRPFLLSVAALAVGALLLTQGLLFPKEGEGTMKIPGARSGVKAALPPIDAAVPKRIETATFALG